MAFNGKLENKEQLQKFTKNQLIDMLWESNFNTQQFLDLIFNDKNKYENAKSFYFAMKDYDKKPNKKVGGNRKCNLEN